MFLSSAPPSYRFPLLFLPLLLLLLLLLLVPLLLSLVTESAFEVDRVLERYSGSLLEIVLSRRPASLVLLRAPIPSRSICISQPEKPDEHDEKIEGERERKDSTATEISLGCRDAQKSRNMSAATAPGTRGPNVLVLRSYLRLCMRTTT